jgi:hypothetical protein
MSPSKAKKKPAQPVRVPHAGAQSSPKPAAASNLRAQTRKMLGKHYRAKYGVR